MQSFYPEHFRREMGCTEAEWLGWLPRAIGPHPYVVDARKLEVQIGSGRLCVTWEVAEARRLGVIALPRLLVTFDFAGLDAAARLRFMKHFDLYTQRGGG